MTRQRNAQFNQQHKREASQATGILQRAVIRSVPRTSVYHTEDAEFLAFSNSPLRQDFSRVSISTTKPSQIMAKLKIGAVGNKYEQEADRVATEVASQLNTVIAMPSGQAKAIQRKQITRESEHGEGIGAFRVDKKNTTGLPDNLQAGIENLSGMVMDDVKVHYNSAKPSQLQAFAYTKGKEIYVGRSQERHLPHEAWHVVQQKQGRVKPTLQAKGSAINVEEGLEREADMMGAKAATSSQSYERKGKLETREIQGERTIQRKIGFELENHAVKVSKEKGKVQRKDVIYDAAMKEGWKLEVDDTADGGVVEFVIGGKDGTGFDIRKEEEKEALQKAIEGVSSYAKNNLHQTGKTVVINGFTLKNSSEDTYSIQATAGIRMDIVSDLFEYINKADQIQQDKDLWQDYPNIKEDANKIELFKQGLDLGNIISGFDLLGGTKASKYQFVKQDEVEAAFEGSPVMTEDKVKTISSDRHLLGLLSMIKTYTYGNKGGSDVLKNITPVLGKTDFRGMALGIKEDTWKSLDEDAWMLLCKKVTQEKGEGMKFEQQGAAHVEWNEWIRGLWKGEKDALGGIDKGSDQSIGNLGEKVEVVAQQGIEQIYGAILEFRNIGSIRIMRLKDFEKRINNLVHIINKINDLDVNQSK